MIWHTRLRAKYSLSSNICRIQSRSSASMRSWVNGLIRNTTNKSRRLRRALSWLRLQRENSFKTRPSTSIRRQSAARAPQTTFGVAEATRPQVHKNRRTTGAMCAMHCQHLQQDGIAPLVSTVSLVAILDLEGAVRSGLVMSYTLSLPLCPNTKRRLTSLRHLPTPYPAQITFLGVMWRMLGTQQ